MLNQLARFEVITRTTPPVRSPVRSTLRRESPPGTTRHISTSCGAPCAATTVRRTSLKQGSRCVTSLDPRVQATGEQALGDELTRLDRQRKTKDGVKLEGAIVVTAPQSGDVIAVIGGRQLGFDGFNRALDARRSIGSLAKPMVYLAALETGSVQRRDHRAR